MKALVFYQRSVIVVKRREKSKPSNPSWNILIVLKHPRKGQETGHEHRDEPAHKFRIIEERSNEETNRSRRKRNNNNDKIHREELLSSVGQANHPIVHKQIEQGDNDHIRNLYNVSTQKILRQSV